MHIVSLSMPDSCVTSLCEKIFKVSSEHKNYTVEIDGEAKM